MKDKDFLVLYLAYLEVILAGSTFVYTVFQEYVTLKWHLFLVVLVFFVALPFLGFFVSTLQGTFAKWLRILVFYALRVETFAGSAFLALFLFTLFFLWYFFRGIYKGEQIFLNVLCLNTFFIFFLALVIVGRFQIKQPPALLIRNRGQSEVYLYIGRVLRHIPDPPTLLLLGYSFADVIDVNDAEFRAYTIKADLDSVTTALLVRVENKPKETWMIFGETRKLVPNEATLNYILERSERQSIEIVPEDKLQRWEESSPLVPIAEWSISPHPYTSAEAASISEPGPSAEEHDLQKIISGSICASLGEGPSRIFHVPWPYILPICFKNPGHSEYIYVVVGDYRSSENIETEPNLAPQGIKSFQRRETCWYQLTSDKPLVTITLGDRLAVSGFKMIRSAFHVIDKWNVSELIAIPQDRSRAYALAITEQLGSSTWYVSIDGQEHTFDHAAGCHLVEFILEPSNEHKLSLGYKEGGLGIECAFFAF